eukprot:TRINITY_DN8417_c0_g1_i1.p1 TRINITY_DN8417_c0_g1~~TRINITY_DN8417_c0_g1_i1.p1  ORF type:complete len:185 (+),score=49.59 TRINITY_DN8417_c0_g1_i1:70-624(+)
MFRLLVVLVAILIVATKAKSETRSKDQYIVIQADRDVKFSTNDGNTTLAEILAAISVNTQNANDGSTGLQQQISSLSSQVIGTRSSLTSQISSQALSLTQAQATAVGSLETQQTQLSNALSTTQQGLDATVSAEISTLEQLIRASNTNLTLNLNDTVKISELETSGKRAAVDGCRGLHESWARL